MTDETNDEFNDAVEPDIEQPDVEPDIEQPDVEHAGATAGPLLGAAAPEYKLPTIADTCCDVYFAPWPEGSSKFDVDRFRLQASPRGGTAYIDPVPYETIGDSIYLVHLDFPMVGHENTDGVSGRAVTISNMSEINRLTTKVTISDPKYTKPYTRSVELWFPSNNDTNFTQGTLTFTGYVPNIQFASEGYYVLLGIWGAPSLPAATVADLEARWHTLTDTEKSVASTLIGDAVAYLKRITPNYDAIPTDTIKSIVCAMVKRAMLSRDSSGISQQSETVGSFSASYTWSNPTGDLYLTREERRQLGLGAQHAGGWEL